MLQTRWGVYTRRILAQLCGKSLVVAQVKRAPRTKLFAEALDKNLHAQIRSGTPVADWSRSCVHVHAYRGLLKILGSPSFSLPSLTQPIWRHRARGQVQAGKERSYRKGARQRTNTVTASDLFVWPTQKAHPKLYWQEPTEAARKDWY